MMFAAASFLALAGASVIDREPTLCAIFLTVGFILWFGAAMSPDSEKYTPEYLRSHKGWL